MIQRLTKLLFLLDGELDAASGDPGPHRTALDWSHVARTRLPQSSRATSELLQSRPSILTVRLAANQLRSASRRNRGEANKALFRALSGSEDAVTTEAALALKEVSNPDVVDTLLGMLENAKGRIRDTGANALAGTDDARTQERVLDIFLHNPDARFHAAFVLRGVRNPTVVAALTRALAAPRSRLRAAAASALEGTKDPDAYNRSSVLSTTRVTE